MSLSRDYSFRVIHPTRNVSRKSDILCVLSNWSAAAVYHAVINYLASAFIPWPRDCVVINGMQLQMKVIISNIDQWTWIHNVIHCLWLTTAWWCSLPFVCRMLAARWTNVLSGISSACITTGKEGRRLTRMQPRLQNWECPSSLHPSFLSLDPLLSLSRGPPLEAN